MFIPHFFKSIFIKIKTNKNKYHVIGNIYRPNTAPLANIKKFNEELEHLLIKIKTDPLLNKCEGITLLGDFNIDLLQYLNHSDTNEYLDILLSNECLPLITLPTRVTHRSASVIDHISTTIKDNNYDAGIILTDLSDHFATFYICDSVKVERNAPSSFKVRKINKDTTQAFKTLLNDYSWQNVLMSTDPKTAFGEFFFYI